MFLLCFYFWQALPADSSSLPSDSHNAIKQQKYIANAEEALGLGDSKSSDGDSSSGGATTHDGDDDDGGHSGGHERYPLAQVEFDRVKTPFIIGVWILSASIAKIGKSVVMAGRGVR